MRPHNFRSLLLAAIFCITSVSGIAQVPEMFNYQAVARDIDRNPIVSTNLNVKVAILFSSPTGLVLWEEQHSVLTSEEGIFSLKVGDPAATKTAGTMSTFSDIDWQAGYMFIRPSIEYQSTWHEMDASSMVSVPYALVAKRSEIGQFPVNGDVIYLPDGSLAIGSDDAGGSKLAVVSGDDTAEDALFEVKRADGQTVFAVYPDAVRIYVARGDPLAKARSRGGFAIGGFDEDKATPINDLFWLTPDSVRFYIDDTPQVKAPGSRGGFAIGGFDTDKALGKSYMSVSGSAVPDIIQASSQILFYPLKDAFMAGYIEVEDPDMVGQNSASIGYKNVASGRYSQSFGYLSQATGDYSMAVGNTAIASGISTFAFGFHTSASGHKAVALGSQADAQGPESLALGVNSQSIGMNSIALGYSATANTIRSTAIGYEAVSNGDGSVSLGYQADTPGDAAVALGYQSSASGYRSTAFTGGNASGVWSMAGGPGTLASGDMAVSLGAFNRGSSYRSVILGSWGQAAGDPNAWVATDPLLVIGNGNGAYNNAMEILKNGNVGIGGEPGNNKLYVAGEILATGSITPSDFTLKKNIIKIADASSTIKEIEGVSFDFRTDEYPELGLPDGKHYGVIAQDMENILPNLVTKGPNGKLAVAYTEIIPILVEAFKEQQAIIESKQTSLIELENENAEIKARLDALEALVGSMLEEQ